MSAGGGESSASGSGKIPTYYVGMHMILCNAPIDFIAFVQVKEKLINSTPIMGTEQRYFDLPELFGGLKREGGLKGWISFLFGGASQTAHPYLTMNLGASVPAYREVVSVILNRLCLGTSYYMHPWRFFATRVTVRGKGLPQWQPIYACPQLPLNLTFSFTYLGVETEPQNFGLVATSGAPNEVHTGYYVVAGLKVWLVLDESKLNEPTGFMLANAAGASAAGGLINAVHVIRECLTDTEWGLGEPENTVDETSFVSAAQTCFLEGLGFSWLWDKTQAIGDFIAEVAGHINAVVYRDRKTNLWKITLIRKVADLESLPVLTTSHVQKINKLSRKQFHELTSQYLLKYESNLTFKEATFRVSDPSLAARQGKEVLTSNTFSGVATPEVAQVIAERELRYLSTPVYTGSLTGDRTLAELNPGDAFVLKAFGALESDLVLRVVSIDLGTILKEPVTIDFTEDAFETTRGVFELPAETKWSPPNTDAVPVEFRKIFESPYLVQAIAKGDATAQAIPTTSTFLRATAVSPSGLSISADLWDTASSVFAYKGVIDFQFSGLLAENLDKETSIFSVSTLTDEVSLGIGTLLYLDEELLFVTNYDLSLNLIEVRRGVLDTVPEPHTSGTRFIGVKYLNSSDTTEFLISETVRVKLLTTTPSATLSLASAPEDTLDFIGRMHRPYPPGNLKINGVSWPPSVDTSESYNFTWASRNRFQQTTSDVLSYYAASVTSETAVTYNLKLYLDSDNSVLYSFTGTGLSKEITILDLPVGLTYPALVRVELNSENQNGVSFQTVSHTFTIPAP